MHPEQTPDFAVVFRSWSNCVCICVCVCLCVSVTRICVIIHIYITPQHSTNMHANVGTCTQSCTNIQDRDTYRGKRKRKSCRTCSLLLLFFTFHSAPLKRKKDTDTPHCNRFRKRINVQLFRLWLFDFFPCFCCMLSLRGGSSLPIQISK